jgi:hypothetical protein
MEGILEILEKLFHLDWSSRSLLVVIKHGIHLQGLQ